MWVFLIVLLLKMSYFDTAFIRIFTVFFMNFIQDCRVFCTFYRDFRLSLFITVSLQLLQLFHIMDDALGSHVHYEGINGSIPKRNHYIVYVCFSVHPSICHEISPT